jgi:hypothetical protein
MLELGTAFYLARHMDGAEGTEEERQNGASSYASQEVSSERHDFLPAH